MIFVQVDDPFFQTISGSGLGADMGWEPFLVGSLGVVSPFDSMD